MSEYTQASSDAVRSVLERLRWDLAINAVQKAIRKVPLPLLLIGKNGSIVDANESALAYYGFTPDELHSRCYFERAENPAALSRHIAESATLVPEHRHTVGDGMHRRVELHMTYFDGHLEGVAMVAVQDLGMSETFRDIDGWAGIPRRHEDEAARKKQEQVVHSARLIQMGEMASTMAHEVNQPLTAIANFSRACMRSLGDNEEAAKYLEKIEQQALRAGEIVWRMRDFSRKKASPRIPICLAALVEQVFDWVRSSARMHDIRLVSQVPEGRLPMVNADHVQIEQVLLNLITNGIDALRDTTHERTIVVSIRPLVPTREILVSVQDTGAGIPRHIARDVFKPFFTTKENGLGLGLSVSRSIIKDHGGRLWLSFEQATHGTTFFFTLPTVQGDLDA